MRREGYIDLPDDKGPVRVSTNISTSTEAAAHSSLTHLWQTSKSTRASPLPTKDKVKGLKPLLLPRKTTNEQRGLSEGNETSTANPPHLERHPNAKEDVIRSNTNPDDVIPSAGTDIASTTTNINKSRTEAPEDHSKTCSEVTRASTKNAVLPQNGAAQAAGDTTVSLSSTKLDLFNFTENQSANANHEDNQNEMDTDAEIVNRNENHIENGAEVEAKNEDINSRDPIERVVHKAPSNSTGGVNSKSKRIALRKRTRKFIWRDDENPVAIQKNTDGDVKHQHQARKRPRLNTTDTGVGHTNTDASKTTTSNTYAVNTDTDAKQYQAKSRPEQTTDTGVVNTRNRTKVRDTLLHLKGRSSHLSKASAIEEQGQQNTTGGAGRRTDAIRTEPPEQDSSSSGDGGSLKPMDEILVSPYEGNRSAESGEEPLETWKNLMKPLCSGSEETQHRGEETDSRVVRDNNDDNTHRMNPALSRLYGDPLALTIFRARLEIAKSEPLYEANWQCGIFGDSNIGWIPKRQLLLCLHEDKIGSQPTTSASTSTSTSTSSPKPKADSGSGEKGRGKRRRSSSNNEDDCNDDSYDDEDDSQIEEEHSEEDEVAVVFDLQTVVRKFECFKLVIAAMREWKLKYEYPELYSIKDIGEFVFRKKNDSEDEISTNSNDSNKKTTHVIDEDTKRNCYKCQIFVARIFAILLLFNKKKKASPSLMNKAKACLAIMNKHVRAHPGEMAKLLNKKRRKEAKEGSVVEPKTKPKRQKTIATPTQQALPFQEQPPGNTKTVPRLIEGTYEERVATLRASFDLIQREGETLARMMDYYRSRLRLVDGGHLRRHRRRHLFHPCLGPWSDEIVTAFEQDIEKEEWRRQKKAELRLRK